MMLQHILGRDYIQIRVYSIIPAFQEDRISPQPVQYWCRLPPSFKEQIRVPSREQIKKTAKPRRPSKPNTPEITPQIIAREIRLSGGYQWESVWWFEALASFRQLSFFLYGIFIREKLGLGIFSNKLKLEGGRGLQDLEGICV